MLVTSRKRQRVALYSFCYNAREFYSDNRQLQERQFNVRFRVARIFFPKVTNAGMF